jgi:hypothetical protein
MGWTNLAACLFILILVADAFLGHIVALPLKKEQYSARYADFLPPIRTWVHPGLYVLTAIVVAWAFYASASVLQTAAMSLFLVAIAAGGYDYLASVWDRARRSVRASVHLGKQDIAIVSGMAILCAAATPVAAVAIPSDPNIFWYGLLGSISLYAAVALVHVSAPIRYRTE